LKKYNDFSSRSNRAEYWLGGIVNAVIAGIIASTDIIVSNQFGSYSAILSIIYSLVTLVPFLAVTVRRLHDVGKSGWKFFYLCIPLIGPIWILYVLLKRGDQEINKYGEPTKKQNIDTLNI